MKYIKCSVFSSLVIAVGICIWGFPVAASSDDSINEPIISEALFPPHQWDAMIEIFSFSEKFPSINIYDRSGICIVQLELTVDWSSDTIHPPEALTSDGSCDHYIPEGFGSSELRETAYWTVRLQTLGDEFRDFCTACVHVENELRAMVEKYPELWMLEIARVSGASSE